MNTATLLTAVLLSAASPWRSYEIYQPTISRHTVVDGDVDELNYNHGSAIVWFGDRWFCLWNANQIRDEGKPGQLIYFSTSRDGRAWSRAGPAFASSEHSVNPVPCPRGVQWQPNLIVVEGELWAAWSQLSKGEHYGCYISRLRTPDGKWSNQRLLWSAKPNPTVDGKSWRVLPLSAPMRLRSGRILVPVTLLGRRAADAPDEATGWNGLAKRSSVLYLDDGGHTWSVSPGAIQPGRSWAQWEPTVWELADGTVMMSARNNAAGKRAQRALLWSSSSDQGATWTPHRPVPLCTAVSRMHVVAAAGGRFVMAHNDWPACNLMGRRYNLALFFTRGAGLDFVAGPGFSGVEPVVAYPCMHVRRDAALVSYSAGHPPRAIKLAHISPLPSPDRHYVFPRTNVPPSAAPIEVGKFLRFAGHHCVVSRQVPDPGQDGFSAGAWVMGSGMVLFDTRCTGPAGGFVWGQKQNRPMLYLSTPERDLMPSLRLKWHEWNYVGITVDNRAGRATFYVDGKSETVRFTAHAPHPLRGTYAHVGAKSLPTSQLRGLDGVLRCLAVYPSAQFGQEEHNWLRNQFAESIDQSPTRPEREPSARPALWFDPVDKQALARDFRFPEDTPRGVEVTAIDGLQVLRFIGESSAGVDLDENHRDRGDRVEIRFRFRLEAEDEHVLCTVGDADTPARVVAKSGHIWLTAARQEACAGAVGDDGWTRVHACSGGDTTQLRVADREPVSINHTPVATWLYLGEGYPPNGVPDGNRFLVDVASVRSRISRLAADANAEGRRK